MPLQHITQTLSQVAEQLDSPSLDPSQVEVACTKLQTMTKSLQATCVTGEPTIIESTFWQAVKRVRQQVQSLLQETSTDTNTTDTVVKLATELLRFIRNYVAGKPSFQLEAVHAGMDQLACIIIQRYADVDAPSNHSIQLSVRIAVQTLCNLITNQPEVCDSIWPTILQSTLGLSSVLRSLAQATDHPTLTAWLVLILNVTKSSQSSSRLLTTTEQGQQVLRQLLTRAEAQLDDTNLDFELIHNIIVNLLEQDQLTPLLSIGKQSNEVITIDPTLLCLLKHIDGYLATHPTFAFTLPTLHHIADLYCTMATWAIHVLDQAKHTTTNLPPIEDTRYSTLFILLQIFIHQSIDQQQAVLDCPNLLATTIALLRSAEQTIPRSTAVTTSSTTVNSIPPDAYSGFDGVKRDTVRLIGHLAHQHKAAQDKIRELGGLALVLGQCAIDDRNPYIREHAILAIRCLLDDNQENQALVAALEPIAAAQHPALEQAGFRVRLDPQGKPRLEKIIQEDLPPGWKTVRM